MAIGAGPRSVFSSYKGEGDAAAETKDRRQRYEAGQQLLWDPALAQAQQQRLAAEQYGLSAEQMRTAAQQQLGAGIQQTRADLMAGAGARGLNPALGRAAGYAGGELGQAGVGMARALQARELAAAQAQQQQALAAQAGLMGQIAEQDLGAKAAEAQAYQAYQALAQQQAAQQQQSMVGYLGAGLGSAASLGGWIGGSSGGKPKPTWTPEYQQQYQQWAETYSDRDLKAGVRQPLSAAEAELLDALREEGARTEARLSGTTGRAITPSRLGTAPTPAWIAAPAPSQARQTLGSLSGAGRQYRYTPEAQQQLGQPAGLQYGPMAQDLAKTELGASAVVPTPQGLAVDTGRLSLIQAGLMGEQQRQIEEIQRQLAAENRRVEQRLGGGR